MNRRRLGSSDLEVSEIALGSWLTYSGGVARERAEACVRRALELGINFIDTANAYGRGASEELLGEVLSGYDRSEYVLATKLYFPMSDTDRGLSAKQVHKQLDASLRRLGVEHIDLYQAHRYDEDTPLEETMEAFSEIVRSGKVRHLGFSEWPVERIREARELAGCEPFVSSQPQYSMLWRAPEAEVFGLCAEQGIGQVVWSPLAQGVLTGKYRPGQPPPEGSRASSESMGAFIGDFLGSEQVLEAVVALEPLASEAGLSLAQLALAWVLRRPEVSCAIVGASRPEQLDDNAAASGVVVEAELLGRIDAILDGVAIT